MSNADFGLITLQLSLLLAMAHLLGYLFTQMKQPRVIGEILAGVLLGPSVLEHVAPRVAAVVFPQMAQGSTSSSQVVLGFIYNLGLLLLMFVSGAETKGLFQKSDRRQIGWLTTVGTVVPFVVAMVASRWMPLEKLMGDAQARTSVVLVIGIAVAVTSIPVISKIFYDLGILKTRFARLVLGVAVLEDVALWAVLAIATALAASSVVPRVRIVEHVAATILYLAIGLFAAPALMRKLSGSRWNALATASPVGYAVVVLLTYSAIADAMNVSLVFAAFLAGFALSADSERMAAAIEPIKSFSFAVFVPIYFAVVGYRLDLSRDFSAAMLAIFMSLACLLKLAAAGTGARLAGFGWLSSVNLAVATNARGGPGIVLASVAYDAHIINATFFATLVLVAVFTSQAAGYWLGYVLRKGWPLVEEANGKVAEMPARGEGRLAA
jgi:Kef-type K+ transport system membrane component KefB